ncbi:T7SS effector LXG polymorphic toxin [Furfurilactobacillus sp. WILCCON 0119]
MVKVNMSEVTDGYQKLTKQSSAVQKSYQHVSSALNELASTKGFSGATANNMTSYIHRADITNLRLIDLELSELVDSYKQAMALFQSEVDNSSAAIISSSALSKASSALSKNESNRSTIDSKVHAAISSASSVMSLSQPSMNKMKTDMSDAQKVVKKTHQKLESFSSSKVGKEVSENISNINKGLVSPTIAKAAKVKKNDFSKMRLMMATNKDQDRYYKLSGKKGAFKNAGMVGAAVNWVSKGKNRYVDWKLLGAAMEGKVSSKYAEGKIEGGVFAGKVHGSKPGWGISGEAAAKLFYSVLQGKAGMTKSFAGMDAKGETDAAKIDLKGKLGNDAINVETGVGADVSSFAGEVAGFDSTSERKAGFAAQADGAVARMSLGINLLKPKGGHEPLFSAHITGSYGPQIHAGHMDSIKKIEHVLPHVALYQVTQLHDLGLENYGLGGSISYPILGFDWRK